MTLLPRLLVVTASVFIVGCGIRVFPFRSNTPPPAPPRAPLPVAPFTGVNTPSVALLPDPIAEVISRVEREFETGRAEWERGRLVAAREHFDRAVDLMLDLHGGARSHPRLQAAFEHLLDRISALDVLALREADSFIESRSEPAAIDELLNVAMFERPEPAATTEETVLADLRRTPHDIPIAVNAKVLSFIELFQGRLHDFMQSGLDRGQRYLPMIRNIFESEGVPLDLIYVPLVESAFKTNALSRVAARGMWQFMSPTGREHGLDQTWFIDERSDPEKATRAAAQYLKTLNKMFDGDWYFALASYNAGPGRLQRAVRQSRKTDYWDLTETSRYLPRETREYVPMILAAIIIAKNPTLYGFQVTAPTPLAAEFVHVPGPLDLKYIAEWANVDSSEIEELNPELRRQTTPIDGYELKVPVGTAVTIQRHLADADALYRRFRFHTVRRGETVTSIARKYKVTTKELRETNGLNRTARVKTNQVLSIPTHSASALPTASASRPQASAGAQTTRTYRVRPGDTLFSIARQFDTTVSDLKRLNRLSGDRIAVGDRLTVRR